MSAVFGILRFDGADVRPRDMERMQAKLAQRGPDGCRFVVDGPLGLGHCLLRVNIEDRFEAQPLHDAEAQLTLVADCRIDNRADLAAAFGLSTSEAAAMPDSAFVLRAYKRWGEAAPEHLLGDFAFAVWDGRARKLVLARDHMGQRVLRYFRCAEFFAFATQPQALWALPDVPRELSDSQIAGLLLADPSLTAGPIEGLEASSRLRIAADGRCTMSRYWEPQSDPFHEGKGESYYEDAYRAVLGEAVACRLRRLIHPPGLLFSGGFDSTAIAGLAGPALAPTGRKLVAAASVMPADYRGSIRHARPWVEMCARDMPHLDVRYVTREGKNILSGLERGFVETGLPPGTYQFVAEEMLDVLAGAGVRLVMDGHGGDYTLNPRGDGALARHAAALRAVRLLSEMRATRRASGRTWRSILLRDVVRPLLPPRVVDLWRRMRGRSDFADILPIAPALVRNLPKRDGSAGLPGAIEAIPPFRMRERVLVVLRHVTRGTGSRMALDAARRGMELTHPFHDRRVVGLALAVPEDLYARGGHRRHLARVALKEVYPVEFQTRGLLNDDQIPDFQRMAKAVEPQILAEIGGMEQSEHLSRYVDFAKMRKLLASRGAEDHNSGWETDTQLALHAFLIARYAEWFKRDNR